VIAPGRHLAAAGRIYIGLVLVFLYAPLAVMAAMSFNSSEFYQLPIDWSLVWYRSLPANDSLMLAARNSVAIAVVTTILASAIGAAASLGLRRNFALRRVLQVLLLPPISIPWLIIGTSMLVFFFWSGIGRGLHSMILGHVALTIPYVIIIVSARMTSYDATLDEAARSLGANPWQIFWRVTFPWMAPSLIAAALFAFAISFDQFTISYFLSVPGVSTLPVEIYTAIRKGFTPEINAISTVVLLVSMVLLLAVARFYRFGGER
jgi:spermidine/putrescine transport system permease protein